MKKSTKKKTVKKYSTGGKIGDDKKVRKAGPPKFTSNMSSAGKPASKVSSEPSIPITVGNAPRKIKKMGEKAAMHPGKGGR